LASANISADLSNLYRFNREVERGRIAEGRKTNGQKEEGKTARKTHHD
jgi:hypothetical protein